MSFKDWLDDDALFKETIEKMAKESISESNEKSGSSGVSTDDVLKSFEEKLAKILKDFSDKISEFKKRIKDLGGISTILKTAWNLEEEEVELLTFESVVKWAKINVRPEKHSAACLIKSEAKGEYHLFFLGKDDKPLLDGSEKHKIFIAKELDDALKSQFSNKSMLLLK
ncbi:MAG: hypothetical protein P1P64_04795 [Treponemataceae bacterium]